MSPMTIGLDLRYSDRLENYDVTFASEIEDLPDFLNSSNTIENQIWQFISTKRTLLTALRIYQTIRQLKDDYEEDNSYVIVDRKNFKSEEVRGQVLETFRSPSRHNLLVIECCSSSAEEYAHELWSELFDITTANPRKRLILIVEGNHESTIEFERGCEIFHVRDYDISIDNLEPGSQRKLLEKLVVSFQGHEEKTSFKRLLDIQDSDGTGDETFKGLGGIIDSNTFVELIEGREIRIGQEIKKLGECAEYYIPRSVIRQVVINLDTLITRRNSDVFAISGISRDSLIKLFTRRGYGSPDDLGILIGTRLLNTHRDTITILDKGLETVQLAQLRYKRSNKKIHWFHYYEPYRLIWKQSFGGVTGSLAENGKESNSDNVRSAGETCLTQEELIDNTKNRGIVIISDKPGTGKSTVLTSIAEKIDENNPNLLVIRIDLANHTKALDMKNERRIFDRHNDTDAAVNFLLRKLLCLCNDLELQVFERLIKHHFRAAILFDGFDEISPDHEDTVISLLRVLSKLELIALFVTTRPHASPVLEFQLDGFSYTLKPFTPENQRDFVCKFWSRKCGLNHMKTISQESLRTCAEAVIERLADSNNRRTTDFIGIPLQMTLIAESVERELSDYFDGNGGSICDIFHNISETFQKYFGIHRGHLHTSDMFMTRHQNLDGVGILELVNRFIDTKYHVYWNEMKSGSSTNSGNKEDYEVGREMFLKAHQKFALEVLFGENIAALLLFKSGLENICKSHQEMFDDVKRTGSVTKLIDGQPHFIHRTLAEYFAATFFIDMFKDNDQSHQVQEFCVLQLFVEPAYQVIRGFLNCLLATEDYQDISWGFDFINHLHVTNQTAYHVAARERHVEIATFLLNHLSADPEVVHSNSNCPVIGRLFERPLLIAVDTVGNLDVVKCFVEAGADVNSKTPWSTTLHTAIEGGDLNVVTYLIDKSVDIESRDINNDTPLHLAVLLSNLDIVKCLIERHADTESQTSNGEAPLHLAAKNGDLAIVEYLTEKQASIESRTEDGSTPLHSAVENEHLNVVEYLINRGASAKSRRKDGLTPLHLAIKKGYMDMVKYLHERQANTEPQPEEETLLLLAVKIGNLDMVEYCVENKADINARTKAGLTPLHLAAEKGRTEIVQYLLSRGAMIESETPEGERPLHIAAQYGHLGVVGYLIEKGASLKARTRYDKTPLDLAVVFGHLADVGRYLILKDADHVRLQTRSGAIQQHLAAGQSAVPESSSLPDFRGVLLHDFVKDGNFEAVKLLIESGTCSGSTNNNGLTPLHVACELDHWEILEYLISQGASI